MLSDLGILSSNKDPTSGMQLKVFLPSEVGSILNSDQVAKDFFRWGPENPQGWRFHNLSALPAASYSHSFIYIPSRNLLHFSL